MSAFFGERSLRRCDVGGLMVSGTGREGESVIEQTLLRRRAATDQFAQLMMNGELTSGFLFVIGALGPNYNAYAGECNPQLPLPAIIEAVSRRALLDGICEALVAHDMIPALESIPLSGGAVVTAQKMSPVVARGLCSLRKGTSDVFKACACMFIKAKTGECFGNETQFERIQMQDPEHSLTHRLEHLVGRKVGELLLAPPGAMGRV